MPKCEQCGKEVELPFECNFCGHYFCMEHRLPENHNCPNQPARTPLGQWKAKKVSSRKLTEIENAIASASDRQFLKVLFAILGITCLVLLLIYVISNLIR
jgi:hypothetical protein